MLVTRNSLQALVDGPHSMHVVGRALVHLFHRQTIEEKRDNDTKVYNNRGFTHSDARWGCIIAKCYIRDGAISDRALAAWTKRGKKGYSKITKYWAQLNEVATVAAQTRRAA